VGRVAGSWGTSGDGDLEASAVGFDAPFAGGTSTVSMSERPFWTDRIDKLREVIMKIAAHTVVARVRYTVPRVPNKDWALLPKAVANPPPRPA
jgi:hypothetical protein